MHTWIFKVTNISNGLNCIRVSVGTIPSGWKSHRLNRWQDARSCSACPASTSSHLVTVLGRRPQSADRFGGKVAEYGDGKPPCLPVTGSQTEVGTLLYPLPQLRWPRVSWLLLEFCLIRVRTLLFIKGESSYLPCPIPFWLFGSSARWLERLWCFLVFFHCSGGAAWGLLHPRHSRESGC